MLKAITLEPWFSAGCRNSDMSERCEQCPQAQGEARYISSFDATSKSGNRKAQRT